MSDVEILHSRILTWYAANARHLPWRIPASEWPWPGVDRPWAVLVSEVMLQQTPVARVEPVWHRWMDLWPTPAALAAAAPGDAVREWGRLGYPRRALRLHAAATAITRDHRGAIPADLLQLQALPGIGSYTAAAVGAFAFGIRSAVVDVNVRRAEARLVTGAQHPAPSLTAAETRLANELLPRDNADAATWNVAVMELGALVCKASTPACGECPVQAQCAWVLAGRPAHDGPRRTPQKWHGTDRQVRGKLLQVLRDASAPVPRAALDVVWHDEGQRDRCLASLVEDGLVEPLPRELFRLPI
ncbi:A/G-specific adenine glycosylase [Flexivirga oryzae]|uniref:A/G-specific adenine glycosylase n=1 Tax=Flexivirga oryzae TaxID=1794944 RepID=A0A839N5A9_9MICO|nr:A/G-specific adenine glycosylase [Flexivirga oryzae]MBB2892930.1 A/G-specific adenine glycosylase [Flexivirga oryzae]